jgi:hypothetical protein
VGVPGSPWHPSTGGDSQNPGDEAGRCVSIEGEPVSGGPHVDGCGDIVKGRAVGKLGARDGARPVVFAYRCELAG